MLVMETNEKGAERANPKTHRENTQFSSQFDTVFSYFLKRPQTMKQVAVKSKIDRANICRYVRVMRLNKQIQVINKGKCPITKHCAGFYTTDRKLFKPENQLSLFQ